ncbi:MAG TPA: acetate--CoA ligase family protein [Burkholderiales bacterium]|jgi:acyl-CoA synthetase (NDP forming)|nr:acetate--CoA ligase family protein [Burkholderiales bacterium]
MSLAQALFAPRSVALVGASGDAAKNTARPQRYLRKHGYAGKLFPVNPTRKEIFGEKAYARVSDIADTVDHAYILIEDVEQALEDCGRRGVPVASVFSGGFSDAGPKGVRRQSELVARARSLGVRLLGPNSMGVIDVPGRLALSVNAVLEMDVLPGGTTSIVSQSGTMLGTLLSRGAARGLGFAKLVSVGNEADLSVGELVELLAADPGTRVILLFLETVRDAERLARAARAARAAEKSVVAYKLGRSELGVAAALSHTGALAGTDPALDAYFRDCGIVRVDMLETLLEISPLLSERKALDLKRPGRVSVVTTTGGGAASVVDRLGMRGIELAAPIMDLTMAASGQNYAEALEKASASECDLVVACVGSSAQFHPELAVQPIIQSKRSKPIVCFFTPHAERSLALAAAAAIPAFRTPEACADAVAALLSWRSPRTPPALAVPGDIPQHPFDLLTALGIPVARWAIAGGPEFSHALRYPVAVKLLEAHKTERGGVALGVASREDLEKAARKMGAARVLVQEMQSGLAEAIVGYRDDPVVGPLVLVGAGGVLAEVYRDYALRIAPVSETEAAEMIEQVKGLATIRGYRNLPRGDVKALAQAVSSLSRLALARGRPVCEAEINPLVVKADGVVAVDALVARKEGA